jgi:CpeT protein
MEFADWFEGEYSNWRQASSRPTSFAHILLTHKRIDENKFHVSQRYSHDPKPYREKTIQIVERGPIIIVENDQCNLVFKKQGGFYRGSTVDGCIFKGTLLVSRVEMGINYYKVIDAGLDPETKEQKWGSTNGPFLFHKKL